VFRLRASVVCLTIASSAFAQTTPQQQNQEPPPAEQPADQYFSGTVVSYAGEILIVARTVLGKNSTSRHFKVNSETQIEGKLKVKARVTVQYITRDEADHAIHIIVRYQTPKK
jgi:hypothetical protein